MFPGMVFAVLSCDPDFVQDIAVLLRNVGADVFAAGSWEEYARLQEEGVVVEMAVVDPVFRLESRWPTDRMSQHIQPKEGACL